MRSSIKIYHKIVVSKNDKFRNRQEHEQRNRPLECIETSEIDPRFYGNIMCEHWEKYGDFLVDCVGRKMAHQAKENEARFLPYIIFIVDSTWKTEMWKAIKLIEESIAEYLCVLWLGKDFLNKIPK